MYRLDPTHESWPQTARLLEQLQKLVPVPHDPFNAANAAATRATAVSDVLRMAIDAANALKQDGATRALETLKGTGDGRS